MAISGEFFPQGTMIFDDTVMDDRNTCISRQDRMGVGLGDATMGRPAGMADTDTARKRRRLQHFGKIFKLTDSPAPVKGITRIDDDPR